MSELLARDKVRDQTFEDELGRGTSEIVNLLKDTEN